MVVFAGADEQQCDYSGGEEGAGDRPNAAGVEGCDQTGEELFVVLGERGEGRGEAEGCGHEGGEGRRIRDGVVFGVFGIWVSVGWMW